MQLFINRDKHLFIYYLKQIFSIYILSIFLFISIKTYFYTLTSIVSVETFFSREHVPNEFIPKFASMNGALHKLKRENNTKYLNFNQFSSIEVLYNSIFIRRITL